MALGGLLGTFLFARLWQRAGVLTDNELIELRYAGKPAAFLRGFKALYFATIYNFIVMGWVINGMSTVLHRLTGVSPELTITILIVIALLYSVLSGYWGVVVTDLVQFILAMTGSVILAVLALKQVGGMEQLLLKLSTAPDFHSGTLDFIPHPRDGAAFLKFMLFITVMWWSSHNADGGGYIIQRMLSARNERHAVLATLWFNVANYALRVWPWIVVALVSMVLIPDIQVKKEAYPAVISLVLGPGLKGLLVTTFLAAFMSTIDTHLNWGSSYLVNDVYKRFLRPRASQAHYVAVSRWTGVLVIILAALIAWKMGAIEKAWVFVWAMGAGIGAVLILRWFWWRVNAWSEISALAASIFITVALEAVAWWQHLGQGDYRLFATAPVLWGTTIQLQHKILLVVPFSLLTWITVTLLTRPVEREVLERFHRRVRPGGFWPFSTPREDSVLRGFLPLFLGGVGLIYGLTFAIGHLVFGHWGEGFLLLGVAVAGSLLIARGLKNNQ
jgi:Na+/proline symporter